MTHPNLILKRIQPIKSIFSSQVQNMHSQEVMNLDIIGHFEKSTKTPFFVKASYMNMEDSIEMGQKGLLRGHLKLSKNSKNTLIGSKLKELCIGEVDLFAKLPKVKYASNCNFCQMGPTFCTWLKFVT